MHAAWRDAAMMKRVEKAAEAVPEAAVSLGGTPTGEHGIGIFQREHVPLCIDGQVLAWMAGVKALFDPNGIMNPGKKLPG
jgi:FAD/FMN-containing dehydrogenase